MARRTAQSNKTKATEPKGSALYEVIKGIDFEHRELVAKPRGVGLFDLVKEKGGDYRCYSCGLCERSCPSNCIEVDYIPEYDEVAFDPEAERAAIPAERPTGFEPVLDKKLLDPVIAGIRSGAGLTQTLHATQAAFGYLPRAALEDIATETNTPLSSIYGVASFYSQFRLAPVGKHIIDVCMGTACHVAGAPLVVEAFSQELEIPVGGTTPDGLFTLQTVNCVGACALAPVVRIGDDETLGRIGPNEARKLVRKLRKEAVTP